MNDGTTRLQRLPLMQERPVARLAIALVFSLAALAVRWALHDVLPPGYPFLSFFPAVILCSFLFGRATGIFSGVLCGLFAWYFFIPPMSVLSFDRPSLIAMAFYIAVIGVDIALIHWMQATNQRLREAREEGRRHADESARLAERSELLFQELQHRVGNNLQMVAAVLSLQLRGLEEPRARRAISDSVARIQVIGSIQRRLYRSDGEVVPLDDFLREVCDQSMRSSGRAGVACRVQAQSGLVLPPDAAVPIALILAEALANALEHGFAQGRDGAIQVTLVRNEDTVNLQVEDDGEGLPSGLDITQAESLGLRLSRILARQLGASYSLENGDRGCVMRLTLPSGRLVPRAS